VTENIEPTPEQIEAAKAVSRMYGQRSAAKTRQTFLANVDRETPGLPEAERQARAYDLYRAHMQRLAIARHPAKVG
jgi:hypothetical protein